MRCALCGSMRGPCPGGKVVWLMGLTKTGVGGHQPLAGVYREPVADSHKDNMDRRIIYGENYGEWGLRKTAVFRGKQTNAADFVEFVFRVFFRRTLWKIFFFVFKDCFERPATVENSYFGNVC